MLPPKRQNLFPPFATTFDGDTAECSKHLGRARGILSLMCRSVPPAKSRTETTADGVEIRVTTNPHHIYINAGERFYSTFDVRGVDRRHYYSNRGSDNSLVPKIPVGELTPTGQYYWFSANALVTWLNNYYIDIDRIYNYIIIKQRLLRVFNRSGLPQVLYNAVEVLCCSVKNNKLFVVTREYKNDLPPPVNFNAAINSENRAVYLTIFDLLEDDYVEQVSKITLITEHLYAAQGCFLQDNHSIFLYVMPVDYSDSNFLFTLRRDYSSFDKSVITIEGDLSGSQPRPFINYKNSIDISYRRYTGSEWEIPIFYYNKESMSFIQYDLVPPSLMNYKTQLCFSSKELGIKVTTEFFWTNEFINIEGGVGFEYGDRKIVFKVYLNSSIIHQSDIYRYERMVDVNLFFEPASNFGTYAFDGRILVVGFQTRQINSSVEDWIDPKSGAVVIDTKLNTHRVLFPTSLPVSLTGNFTLSELPKGAIDGN